MGVSVRTVLFVYNLYSKMLFHVYTWEMCADSTHIVLDIINNINTGFKLHICVFKKLHSICICP